MAVQSKVVNILKEARATLSSSRRWRKGGSLSGGRACIINSIPHIVDLDSAIKAQKIIAEVVSKHGFPFSEFSGNNILMFNDDPKTTYKDVVAVLDEAIIVAESNEN